MDQLLWLKGIDRSIVALFTIHSQLNLTTTTVSLTISYFYSVSKLLANVSVDAVVCGLTIQVLYLLILLTSGSPFGPSAASIHERGSFSSGNIVSI